MCTVIVNFEQARANKLAEASTAANLQNRQTTMDFARLLNDSVDQYPIDPIHQATLLMAKAIDVLTVAGPVPCTVNDQHARASNLLHSVFRARAEMLEKSVRIISAGTLMMAERDMDGVSN
jgi:hypothetical protein